jgi:uncharacterized protein (TIGR03435 family)
MKEGDCVAPEQAKPFGPLSCGGVRKQFGPRQVLEAAGIPMGKLAELLSDEVGRAVVDKTGFTGLIGFRLEFGSARDLAPAAAADSSVASLFAALQEQLGLRLESARGPVEVLVIDSVEQPTAD